MPNGVFVPLRREALTRLLEIARSERRLARDQAAVILERALAEAARDRIADELAEPEPVVV